MYPIDLGKWALVTEMVRSWSPEDSDKSQALVLAAHITDRHRAGVKVAKEAIITTEEAEAGV
jgi:hypothetical protein